MTFARLKNTTFKRWVGKTMNLALLLAFPFLFGIADILLLLLAGLRAFHSLRIFPLFRGAT